MQLRNLIIQLYYLPIHVSSGRNGSLRFSAVSPDFKVVERFLEVGVVNFFVKLDENPLDVGKISFLIQNFIIFRLVYFPV